jgi:hypothetical protein
MSAPPAAAAASAAAAAAAAAPIPPPQFPQQPGTRGRAVQLLDEDCALFAAALDELVRNVAADGDMPTLVLMVSGPARVAKSTLPTWLSMLLPTQQLLALQEGEREKDTRRIQRLQQKLRSKR